MFRVTYVDPDDKDEPIVQLAVRQNELHELFPDFAELFMNPDFSYLSYVVGDYRVIID